MERRKPTSTRSTHCSASVGNVRFPLRICQFNQCRCSIAPRAQISHSANPKTASLSLAHAAEGKDAQAQKDEIGELPTTRLQWRPGPLSVRTRAGLVPCEASGEARAMQAARASLFGFSRTSAKEEEGGKGYGEGADGRQAARKMVDSSLHGPQIARARLAIPHHGGTTASAAAAVALLTLPACLPYVALQEKRGPTRVWWPPR